ncbi:MAG: transporter substrate-binding domain-containing protein [Candidatus Izimaplasma sp.]|nr:transporter substrate-binding domain-containing protein [Candidatus Izimaplasma bacterium]
MGKTIIKVKIFLLITILFFVSITTETEPVNSAHHVKVFLSAAEYDYAPFSVIEDGKPTGFSIDLLQAVGEEMGFDVTFEVDYWPVIKEKLKNDELDILPLVGYTEERDTYFDFTIPYIVMRGNIFVRDGYTNIESEADLFDKKVLVLDGDNSQEWAQSIGLDDELTATKTYTEAFELLSQGNYDAVLSNGIVGEKIIDENDFTNIIPVYLYDDDGVTKYKLQLDGYEQKFSFAVTEGDAELLSILNEGLAIVSQNGTYDDLYQKWFPFLSNQESLSFKDILFDSLPIILPLLLILTVVYIYSIRLNIKQKSNELERLYGHNKTIIKAFKKDYDTSEDVYQYILEKIFLVADTNEGILFSFSEDYSIEIRAHSFADISTQILKENLSLFIKSNTDISNKINNQEELRKNNVDLTPIISTKQNNHSTNLMMSCVKGIKQTHITFLFSSSKFSSEDNNQVTILLAGLWSLIERRDQMQQIEYMSYHDSLTTLYNRRFFEEELKRLDNKRNYPITIIMADVNGLKLINDSLGHSKGDKLLCKVSDVLIQESRANDIVARWGGDEFVMILINTDQKESETYLNRVHKSLERNSFDSIKLSVSFGMDTKDTDQKDIHSVFLNAEKQMYKKKIETKEITRINVIEAILSTLFDKSDEIKTHSKRVSALSVKLAKALNLSIAQINNIKQTGLIHDIGKIVIDNKLLEKPASLTDRERNLINQHPIIGSNILSNAKEYSKHALTVLNHHERPDGKGYPNKIKNDNIPIESKIIAVVDAYEAMTSPRPYRKRKLSKAEAIAEIKKKMGTQFDKKVASTFIEKVLI